MIKSINLSAIRVWSSGYISIQLLVKTGGEQVNRRAAKLLSDDHEQRPGKHPLSPHIEDAICGVGISVDAAGNPVHAEPSVLFVHGLPNLTCNFISYVTGEGTHFSDCGNGSGVITAYQEVSSRELWSEGKYCIIYSHGFLGIYVPCCLVWGNILWLSGLERPLLIGSHLHR